MRKAKRQWQNMKVYTFDEVLCSSPQGAAAKNTLSIVLQWIYKNPDPRLFVSAFQFRRAAYPPLLLSMMLLRTVTRYKFERVSGRVQ